MHRSTSFSLMVLGLFRLIQASNMPVGWDPLTFQGRELCDERGQPLRLASPSLKAVDSLNQYVDLKRIKKLCKKKFGRLEAENGNCYYRGHLVELLEGIHITDESDGTTHIDYSSTACSDMQLIEILYKSDIQWLHTVVNNTDIKGFKVLLEEYPTEWEYQGETPSLALKFFELSPNQELVDLFIKVRRSEAKFFIGMSNLYKRSDLIPNQLIDSQMMYLKDLVGRPASTGFIKRVISRRSASMLDLSMLQLVEKDEERFKVFAKCLMEESEDDEDDLMYSLDFLNDCMSKLVTDDKNQFINLLKNMWLNIMPNYVRQRPDLLKIVWEKTKDMNLEQTKHFSQVFGKLFSTLQMVSNSIIPEMRLEIATRVEI